MPLSESPRSCLARRSWSAIEKAPAYPVNEAVFEIGTYGGSR